MLNLIFAETALELVPQVILRHPSVRRNAKRRGKPAEENLLDRSLHHYAMTSLPDQERRGRPDIILYCLLEAMGSPLNRQGMLRVWVHTQDGFTITVNPETRLPRDYPRFKSLMEQVLIEGRAPPKGEEPLLELKPMGLRELLKEINPEKIVALTSHGEKSSFRAVVEGLNLKGNPAVLIGAFPAGEFTAETLSLADEAASIYPTPLESWTVTSRLIYECERSLELL